MPRIGMGESEPLRSSPYSLPSTPIFPHLRDGDLPEIPAMKIVPLGNRVVVKRTEAETKTAGGIFLPDAARQAPHQGKVLAVGDGAITPTGCRTAPQVSEGDKVLFSSWTGTEIKVAGQELLILSEDDILAIME
jgi:chaperonin GroES